MENDDEQQDAPAVEGISGRGQHFGLGMTEAPGTMDSPGLQQAAARYKAQTPTGYVPTGSASGISADQYQATMGGRLKNSNGSAADTWETKKWF
jgi:hypothetical protein